MRETTSGAIPTINAISAPERPSGRQHDHTRAPRVAHRSRTTSEKGSQFAKLSGGHGAGDGHAPSDGSSQKKLTSDHMRCTRVLKTAFDDMTEATPSGRGPRLL